MVTISRISADDLVDRIATELVQHHMSVDEFLAAGSQNDLEDPALVDLFQLWGDLLSGDSEA